MRILHLIATNFFGGPERQIVRHCEKTRNLGYETAIGTFADGSQQNELIQRARERGVEVRPISVRSAYDPAVFSKLRTLMRDYAPTLICTHGYRSAILGLLVARVSAIPVVAWSRGWTKENLKIRAYESLDKLLIRFADRIVAVSLEQKRRLMKRGIPGRKIQTIHNALDPGQFQKEVEGPRLDAFEEFGIPAGYKVIGTAGRLSPEKGHRYLVESMAIILEKWKDVFLLILGDGVLRTKLVRQARRLGLKGHIAFPGFCDHLYPVLTQMDIFMLPSTTEGLSNIILEAFAASKPVVATAVGGNPELVRHMETGILVPPGSPGRIADAIDFLMSNPCKARALARAGRELLDDDFSLEKQTQKICNMYHQLGKVRTVRPNRSQRLPRSSYSGRPVSQVDRYAVKRGEVCRRQH